MSSKVVKHHAAAKSAPRRIRNRKSRIRNQFSPVVLKLREILQADQRGQKAAYQLGGLIHRPLSSCQKILDGKLPLNGEGLEALLQSDFGDQILAAAMGKGPHAAWYADRSEDLAVFALAKEVNAQQRRVDEVLKRRLGQ